MQHFWKIKEKKYKRNINNDLAVVASHIPMEAVHDTTPLSRFVVLRIFKACLRYLPTALSHLLHTTLQFFLPFLQQLHELQLVSPSPLLPVLHFSSTSNCTPISANTTYYTPHLTIQITSWWHTDQGTLLSNILYHPLPPSVILLPCFFCYIPLQTPSAAFLHFLSFPSSPRCLSLLWTLSTIPRTYLFLALFSYSRSSPSPIPLLLPQSQVEVFSSSGHLLDWHIILSY